MNGRGGEVAGGGVLEECWRTATSAVEEPVMRGIIFGRESSGACGVDCGESAELVRDASSGMDASPGDKAAFVGGQGGSGITWALRVVSYARSRIIRTSSPSSRSSKESSSSS